MNVGAKSLILPTLTKVVIPSMMMVSALIARSDTGATKKKIFSGVQNHVHLTCTPTGGASGAYHATTNGKAVDLTRSTHANQMNSHSTTEHKMPLLVKKNVLKDISPTMDGATNVQRTV